MTDETRSANPAASIHVNHYCCIDGCGKWGGFGFARSRGETPTWWYWEHYPHKPNLARIEADELADAIGLRLAGWATDLVGKQSS